MKKSYFMIAAAALTLASCSNDDIIESTPEQAIGFDNFVNKATKVDATKDNINQFYVCGFTENTEAKNRNFDRTLIKKDNTTGSPTYGQFTYQPLQYWKQSTKYYFMAFSTPTNTHTNPCLSYVWPTTTETPASVSDFHGVGTVTFNNESAQGSEDWLYAYKACETPEAISTAPDKVKFQFEHILSRVIFTFVNDMKHSGYTIKITNLKIDNAHASGTFLPEEYSNPSTTSGWSNQSNSFQINYLTYDGFQGLGWENRHSTTEMGSIGYLIPTTGFQYTISFDVTLQLNGVEQGLYTHSQVKLPLTDLKPGYSYNFIASLNPDNINPESKLFPIEFDVETVKGWNENPDQDIDFPKSEE